MLAPAACRLAPSGRQLLAEVTPVRQAAKAVPDLRVRAGLGGTSKRLAAHFRRQAARQLAPGRQLARKNAPMAAMESSCVVIV